MAVFQIVSKINSNLIPFYCFNPFIFTKKFFSQQLFVPGGILSICNMFIMLKTLDWYIYSFQKYPSNRPSYRLSSDKLTKKNYFKFLNEKFKFFITTFNVTVYKITYFRNDYQVVMFLLNQNFFHLLHN